MTSFRFQQHNRKAKKKESDERWNQKQNDDNDYSCNGSLVATATSISGAYGKLSIGTTTATTMTHHNSFHYSLAVVQLVIVFPLLLLSSFTFGTVSSNASLATTTTTTTTAITRSLLAISSSLADADENDPTNHVFQYNRYLHDDEIENENDNTRGNTTTTTRHTNSLFDHSSTYTAETVCLSPPRGGGMNKNQKEDENDDNSDDNCNDEGSATAATRRTVTLDDQVYLDEAEDRIRDNHMDESYSYNDDDDGMASIINFNNASNIPLQHALLKRRKQFLKLARQKQHFLNKISQVSSLLLRREHDATLVEDGDDDGNNKGRRRKFSKRLSKGRRRSKVRDDNTNYAGKNSSRSEYYESLEYDNDDDDDDDERITFQSDLLRPGRYIHIVTTAALPWFTGTAVNPLLRAAYLHDRLQVINKNTTRLDNIMNGTTSVNSTDNNKNATSTTNTNKAAGEEEDKRGGSYVTLVIPWLELEEDQKQLYNGRVFASVFEQERYVRQWLEESAKMVDAARNLNIVFYNARYHADLGSVFAMGDIISTLPQHQLDVCVLEEPEHVNWFRAPGQGWTKRYNYVV